MTTPSHKPPTHEKTTPSKKRPRRPLRRPPVQSQDTLPCQVGIEAFQSVLRRDGARDFAYLA